MPVPTHIHRKQKVLLMAMSTFAINATAGDFIKIKDLPFSDQEHLEGIFQSRYGVGFKFIDQEIIRIQKHDQGKKICLSTLDDYSTVVDIEQLSLAVNDKQPWAP